jgi:hypothetical protein
VQIDGLIKERAARSALAQKIARGIRAAPAAMK